MSAPQPGQDPQQPFPGQPYPPGQQPYPPAQPYPPGQAYQGQQPYPGPAHPGQPPRPGRKTGFGTALLAALVWPAVNVVLTLAISGLPPSAEAAGAFIGALLIPTLLAALATWLIARRRPHGWRFPLLVLLALPFYLLVRVLAVAGSAAG